VLLNLPFYTVYPLVAAAVVGMIIYWFSRVRGIYTEVMIYPMVLTTSAIGTVFFFLNSGSSGPMILLIISVYHIFIVLTNGKHQYIIFGFLLLGGTILYYLELKFPGWVIPYPSNSARFWDTVITFWFSAMFMASATMLFKRNYNHERKMLALRNQELNELNATIREQKSMLELKTDHLESALNELQEKNQTIQTLMKELNHRVGNNLQLIYSLLNLQESEISDPVARQFISQAKNRIIAISLLHQKLYHTDHTPYIDLPSYIRELCGYLLQDVVPSVSIHYTFHPPAFQSDLKVSIHVGLIVNELITNSLKHAWSSHITGRHINLAINLIENSRFSLRLTDNGAGFDPIAIQLKDTRFGLRFIQSVLTQYSGSMSVKNDKGSCVELEMTFPEIPEVVSYA
jgi:two-component sensor histidine kinase